MVLVQSQAMRHWPQFAIVTLLLGAGCNRTEPFRLKEYVEPRGLFTIKAPDDPVTSSPAAIYMFYLNRNERSSSSPLVTVTLIRPTANQEQYPLDFTFRFLESGYHEPGAVVSAKPISMNSYPGHEIEVTAGRRAPLRARIYVARHTQYILEWDPRIPHSTEIADTFEIPQGS